MKKWFSENWDEVVVYVFTVLGSLWAMIYAAREAGEKFGLDIFWTVLAIMVSIGSAWLAENRGMAAAQKLGVIADAKAGRRKNLIPRLGLGFAFGFLIQASLPQILETLTKAVPGLIQGLLTGSP